MKRIFALLGALLFSTFAGIGYTAPKEDLFSVDEGSYFQVAKSEEEVQYRLLYQTVYGYNADSSEKCDTTRRQENRKAWVEISTRASGFKAGVWDPVYVDGSTVTAQADGSSKVVYTLTGDANIFAPSAGTINTSHYSCNYGHYMEYISSMTGGFSYKLTIENAKCWYCCVNKKEPENDRYTATTSDSMKGQKMSAGDMLCVGRKGTTVTIECTTTTTD